MKRVWKEVGLTLLLACVLPGLLLRLAQWRLGEEQPQPLPPVTEAQQLRLPVLFDGIPREMALEEYLVGVLLQEMPDSFAFEAKKAQAVVARTYALRSWEKGHKHPEGGVCTDHTCCQAYTDPQVYVENGGSPEAVASARQAVEATWGQVLTYDGQLIDATYFSCSGGYTEDAAAVWGADIPYLQSVPSPGEEYAAHYTDTVRISAAELAQILELEPSGQPVQWLGTITRTQGGGVDTLEIGGQTYAGTQLRQLLGLRSTAFTMTAVGDTFVITTRGYGHRVGMSQYGADAMAVLGHPYEEILLHYYAGTQLVSYAGATAG